MHGLALAATLQLYSAEFGVGLIGSSAPYFRIHLPWGSNPVTDPLMSSGTMRICHDGAALSRIAKARVVALEPELWGCCGCAGRANGCHATAARCEKCVRTYWALRIAGVRQPACFEEPFTVPPARVQDTATPKVSYWREMLRLARAEGDDEAITLYRSGVPLSARAGHPASRRTAARGRGARAPASGLRESALQVTDAASPSPASTRTGPRQKIAARRRAAFARSPRSSTARTVAPNHTAARADCHPAAPKCLR